MRHFRVVTEVPEEEERMEETELIYMVGISSV